MNLLNPNNSWQSQNLPEGLVIHNGVISGSPTTKGIFSVPVTVSNPLGSDTKNISITTKHKPGTEKFSVRQDGLEVAKITIPELQAMVQDGTAQTRFNCSNTQIVVPIFTPVLKYARSRDDLPYNINQAYETVSLPPSFVDVLLNFCDFRNVTLQDGSVRPALIFQFASALWTQYAPFDTGDTITASPFNRWRYSNLRQWLNSEGSNWFTPAYDGDALVSFFERVCALNTHKTGDTYGDKTYTELDIEYANIYNGSVATYADSGSLGFLDLLPDDIHSILQPIKIVTQAFFDDENDNPSIEDPDIFDGFDADITFDKVFLPSIDEMYLYHRHSIYASGTLPSDVPMIEGPAWAFYRQLFGTDEPFGTNNQESVYSDWYTSDQSKKISAFGSYLRINPLEGPSDIYFLTRSANVTSKTGNWCVGRYSSIRDITIDSTANSYLNAKEISPAPAFAIC
jgi:hypothetical protein